VAKLPGIAEIFKAVSDAREEIDRQNILASHAQNKTMIMVLKCFFDPSIQLDLPEGAPPYRPLPKSTDAQGRLYREMKKMYLFEKNGVVNVSGNKKEQIFVQMLETIDPDDALLLIGMKDKKMPYPNLTAALVKRTFPGLLPDVPFREEVSVFSGPDTEQTDETIMERRKPGPKPKPKI
jgi:hypothetical protein